ncbi:MAG: LuxR C-terminal-related transcriptional regulator [Cyanobacteria bacterium P01_A01_bin.45]
MSKFLHSLFLQLASAKDEHQLRMHYMDAFGSCFAVQRWGIYMIDEKSHYRSGDVKGISKVDGFVELYEKVGRAIDPVMQYVTEHHAPAHEEMVLPPGGWKQCLLYKNCCGYYDHEHIMTGPIVGNGNLIGAVYFARVGDTPAFTNQDITNLSAICTNMSACLATIQVQKLYLDSYSANLLTPREIQIAQLVAQGLTNIQISKELWITSNSVK